MRLWRHMVLTLGLAAGLGLGVRAQESGTTVRIATYNVGVFNKYDQSGIGMTAEIVREMDPDVIVLNEVDKHMIRTGFRNQLKSFCKAAGYEGTFAPALRFPGGAYGIAEAWKEGRKPLDVFKMRLPKGDGAEVRALVAVEYEDMVVAGTHLDYRSEAAQIGQVEALTDTLKAMYGHKGKPVFLCGDMNAVPGSGTMDRLREDWEILSPLEATYADRCIDYILVLKGSAECEVVAGEVGDSFDAGSPYEASDHLPVWIEVRF